ncbi:MAG TPA: hypothetical protein VGG19_16590 [Tepidisphaeraceae bacterium]|jgi:hypothetical protein
MPHQDDLLLDEARSLLDDLCVRGIPITNLLQTGAFPEGWPPKYLEFVERVAGDYPPPTPLPHEIMALIYAASVYCTKRYSDWQHLTSGINNDTEGVVNKVRWAGDRLILSPYYHHSQSAGVA